ncbi:MAG: Ribosomal protein L11 methyltransferase [uncultured Sphingomonas sp.]|uniref:Ribosomal protein L11 methyltransferase n=1 Tax=uncultured Sphingomonas sp. TaxID=158754 RepID=A0A6J4SW56_9SPHN|nr:50S ribosomal protein L11 methyltransferase [uncultured Sphingomonas sp.]CAA9507197.1 MAG: Ribosomal protein L11 methyltransferase [uncultured Sphingomonas sp.]
MSWRATLPCTRAQAEALPQADDLFAHSSSPPVLVADEPDPAKPDDWLLHAYFEDEPDAHELGLLASLADGPPQVEQLGDEDWVTRSQAGLEPIRAGRFFVHTPSHVAQDGAVNFQIDAGLAFGTGQHATTKGCLGALDRLERDGRRFRNIADIGTGTGLLAFAALKLWPEAQAIATDIDPVAVEVARDNAAINCVPLGENPGELLLAVAGGMDHSLLAARASFDLLIANILAGPLIDLAPAFASELGPGGTIVLAGLLDTQAQAVAVAYTARGLTLVDAGSGEWPVLVLSAT